MTTAPDSTKRTRAGLGDAQALFHKALCWRKPECLLWPFGCRYRGRRPCVGLMHRGKDKIVDVQAYLAAELLGARPRNHSTCTSCGNALCVNPLHLAYVPLVRNSGSFKPGHAGNSERPRQLTAELVAYARKSDLPTLVLTKQLGVSASALTSARLGYSWKHVGTPARAPQPPIPPQLRKPADARA